MNVVKENLANQTALLKVTVTSADYAEQVEKQLKEYKRKANVPGFRPGMVPMGIINKMYRKGLVADTAYRQASEACFDYVKAQQIDILGDLMPSDQQGTLDFDNAADFEFCFEVGLAPEINLDFGKESLVRYTVEPSKEMREGYRNNYLRRFGRLVDVESVTKDEAITGSLTQGETTIDEAYVGLIGMSDDERKPFLGKKVGDQLAVNVNELYKTPSQRASILGVKEGELDGIDPNYTLTINQIRQFANPELNEEFFKMVFPAGDVTTEAEFEAKIDTLIAGELAREAQYKFADDLRRFVLAKIALPMPEQFLKNWLFAINEGKFTPEQIDAEFASFLEIMRWDLVKRHVARAHNLEVSDDEAKTEAKALAMMQFQYYGMHTVADDMLENYAGSILSNKEEAKKIYDKVGEQKVVDQLAGQIKIAEKKVGLDEFQKMAQEAR